MAANNPHPAYTGIDNLEVMREAKNYNRYLASLVAAQVKVGDKVLDFGAGAGTFALPLIEQGVDIVCVEPDPDLKAHLQWSGATVYASLAEINKESVGLVYTLNVLEHVHDDTATMRELADKIKPGGRLLVYVPAFDVLYSAMDRKVGHVRRYRRAALVDLVTATGLRVIEAKYADSLGFVAALLYRVLGNDGGDINRGALLLYDRLAFPISRVLDRVVWRWIGKNLVVIAVKT